MPKRKKKMLAIAGIAAIIAASFAMLGPPGGPHCYKTASGETVCYAV